MKKIYSLGILAVLCTVLLAFPALATVANYTVTSTAPASSGSVSGTYKLITTITNTTALGLGTMISNTTWFYTQAGGSATYITQNITNINETTTATGSIDSKALYDQYTYTFTTCIWNKAPTTALLQATTASGENVSCTTATNVNMANHAPVVAMTKLVANLKYNLPLALTGTVTNSSSCQFLVGNQMFTGVLGGTAGAETCSMSLTSNQISEGTYSIAVIGADVSATPTKTTSSAISVILNKPSSQAKAPSIVADMNAQAAAGQGMSNSTKAAIVVGVLGIGYYLIAIKKVKILKMLGGK